MEKRNHKKYPAGHWLGVALGTGLIAGLAGDVVLSVFADIQWLWFGAASTVGLALGAVAGLLLENRKKHLRHHHTPAEKQKHRQIMMLTAMSVIMLVMVSVFLLLKKLGG